MEERGDRLMIIDMGTHMLSGQVGSQNVLQVAVPGIEDRARTFPPLHGVLLLPGEPASLNRLHVRLPETACPHPPPLPLPLRPLRGSCSRSCCSDVDVGTCN